jgi:hypothetical protein
VRRRTARAVPVERLEIEGSCTESENPALDRAPCDAEMLGDVGERNAFGRPSKHDVDTGCRIILFDTVLASSSSIPSSHHSAGGADGTRISASVSHDTNAPDASAATRPCRWLDTRRDSSVEAAAPRCSHAGHDTRRTT